MNISALVKQSSEISFMTMFSIPLSSILGERLILSRHFGKTLNIVSCKIEDMPIDMPVGLVFEKVEDQNWYLPRFKSATKAKPLPNLNKKEHIAIVTLNRSEVLNVMDDEMIDQLYDVWVRVRDERSIWVAIVTDAGRPPSP